MSPTSCQLLYPAPRNSLAMVGFEPTHVATTATLLLFRGLRMPVPPHGRLVHCSNLTTCGVVRVRQEQIGLGPTRRLAAEMSRQKRDKRCLGAAGSLSLAQPPVKEVTTGYTRLACSTERGFTSRRVMQQAQAFLASSSTLTVPSLMPRNARSLLAPRIA